MPRCTICLQQRRSLMFQTGRLSICGRCVSSLNRSKLSPREAEQALRQRLRDRTLQKDPSSIGWVDGWLAREWDTIKIAWMGDPERVRKSHALKIMRAHKRGLICWDRQYLDYPTNWPFRRFVVVHLDGYACRVCGAQRLHGAELHVHHIVFRSNSGTSDRRNLVTLCFKHHQDQHDHPISSRGGEGPGSALDASVDMIGEDEAYESLVPAMQAALHYFRATKGTRHELFCYLIGKHGSESGRLALRFAREARLLHDLSTPGEPA